MLIKRPADIPSSEITDKKVYLNRREFIRAAGGTALATAAGPSAPSSCWRAAAGGARAQAGDQEEPAQHDRDAEYAGSTSRPTTTSTSSGPTRTSPRSTPRRSSPSHGRSPSTANARRRARLNLEDILKGVTLEDRIYRHRCVEAWSMVIPWVGFPLADFIKKCEPTSKAKFVEFTTLYDPRRMPGQQQPVLRVAVCRRPADGRSDAPADDPGGRSVRRGPAEPERRAAPAGHALEVRLQGRQVDREDPLCRKAAAEHLAANGAAGIRLLCQRESGRSIIPRWSQATERRLPSLFKNTKTQLFNGYGDQVASMYTGMDLRKNF